MNKEELKRSEIITVAQKLFQTYELHKTTMEDIAKAMGASKSSLYYYFENKEEVFYAVAEKELGELVNDVTAEMNKYTSTTERISAYFATHFKNFKSKVNLYAVSIKEIKKHMELFGKIQNEMNTSEFKMIRDTLLDGVKSGELKGITAGECDTIAAVGLTTLRGLELNIVLLGDASTDEEKFNTMIKIFIRGIK